MNFRYIFFFVLTLGVSISSWASSSQLPPSFWRGNTWLEQDSPEAWEQASRRVLAQVLVKVTGQPAVRQLIPRLKATASVHSWVQQYSMLGPMSQVSLPATSQAVQIQLDEAATKHWLTQQHVAVWSGSRPNTLLWLLVDHDGHQDVLFEQHSFVGSEIMQQAFEQRGLTVTLPQLDQRVADMLQDKQLWHLDIAPILRASDRYAAEQVVVVKVVFQPHDQHWHAQLHLLDHVDVASLQYHDASLSVLLNKVADSVLHQSYVTAKAKGSMAHLQPLRVAVAGIHSAKDLDHLLTKLQAKTWVAQVRLLDQHAQSVELELLFKGSRSRLVRHLLAFGAWQLQQKSPINGQEMLRFVWGDRSNSL